MLGVGGVRVLRRLGLAPTVFHMNEGHSAFLQLERLRELVEDDGLATADALEHLRASTVFTTHTPVPAGNEQFDPELVRRNVGDLVARCGLGWDEFAALGKVAPDDTRFGLTPFALRTSRFANGVSELHGEVVAGDVAPAVARPAVHDVPITSVTNGVHQRTWISGELEELLGDTDPQFERARETSDADAVGCAREREAAAARAHRDDARRAGARSRRADDRLRAPVRDVQALEPPLLAARPARRAARAIRSGRSRCSSPGRRTRRTRRART